MRHVTLFTIAFAACALAACGKSPGGRAAEAAVIEAGTGEQASVDSTSDTIATKTEHGDVKPVVGDPPKLPASFPPDVYLPGNYVVEGAMEMPGVIVVALDTKGRMAALADDAGRQMVAQGWTQSFTTQGSADSQMTIYDKDDRSATVSFSTRGDIVKVGLQISERQQ